MVAGRHLSWGVGVMAALWLSGLARGQQQGGNVEAAKARLQELGKQVVDLLNQCKYAEAKPLAEEALSLAEKALGPDDPLTARGLNNLASVLWKLGDLNSARPLFERALAITEKTRGPDDPLTARALNNLARLLQDMGELHGARPLYERALAIREKALGSDHPDTAASLNNLAAVLYAMGDLGGARPLYERALAFDEAKLGPEDARTGTGLSNLARLLQDLGELGRARTLFERALAIHEKALGPGHPDTATTLNNLASVLQDMGDLKGARPLFERALAVREKTLGADHPGTAQSLNNLASLLQAMGDLKGARPLFDRALAIREKTMGRDHADTAQSLSNIASLIQATGDMKGARPFFERALATDEKALGAEHPTTAVGASNLAYVLQETGDLKGARALYERARAINEKALGLDHHATALTLNNLARVHQAMGDKEGARPLFDRAWEVNRKDLFVLLPVLSDEERCGLVAARANDLAYFIAGRATEPRSTYSALLAWKGAALRASAARRLPAEASAEARAVNADLVEKRRAYARLATSPPTPKPGEPTVGEQYQALRDDVGRLERKLGELLPDFARRAFLDVTVADVQEVLPPDAALVEMLENCGTVHAWVVRKGADPLYWKLGTSKELGDLAKAFRDALAAEDRDAWKKAGAALRERLKGPLEEALAHAKTLCISPDGGLATIPFALLPDGDGFLIERCPVVTVMGGAALVMASRTKRNAACEGLLAIGDVDYDAAEGATGKGARAEHQAPRLPATKAEAAGIVKRFATRFPKAVPCVLTGKDATEVAFSREAPKARFIHAATHGYFDLEHLRVAFAGEPGRGFSGGITSAPLAPETVGAAPRHAGWNPLLLSGLVLAGANQGDGGHGDDGSLTAEELQSLDLTGTDLVVLSACETGCGELAAGEGVLGLGRSLFVAGARGFMLSLWQVPDTSTRDLMDGFYSGLWGDRPLTPEDALRATQLRMLSRDREKNAFHPKDWGAWVLIR